MTDLAAATPSLALPKSPSAATAVASHHLPRRPLGTRGWIGLGLVLVVVLAGVLAPVLAPYDPLVQLPSANLLTPSAQHLLGTDEVNRDVFSRLLHGIRTDLLILSVAVPVGAALGTVAALVGTLHPLIDLALQRLFDVVLSFPTLILAIGLVAVIGPGVWVVMVVIAVVEAPVFARMVRSRILTVRSLPFVDTARSMGAPSGWDSRSARLPQLDRSARGAVRALAVTGGLRRGGDELSRHRGATTATVAGQPDQ